MPETSAIYLSLGALLYVWLSLRVINVRHTVKAAFGDGDDKILRKRIRAHGNFSEYAPILFLLLVVAELQGTPGWVLHGFGGLILLSRGAHAYFISQSPEPLRMRVFSMATTFGLIVALALGNLAHALW